MTSESRRKSETKQAKRTEIQGIARSASQLNKVRRARECSSGKKIKIRRSRTEPRSDKRRRVRPINKGRW